MPVEIDLVARRACHDQPRRQLLAELGDEDLHHLRRALRHLLAPEVVDETIDRHDPARVKQQQREQRLLLAACQLDGAAVADGLERSENSKLHACLSGDYRRANRP